MDEKKQIKIKNYAILGIIFLVGIILTLYLCKCYEIYSLEQKEIPVIRDSLLEITSEDFDHYLLENPSSIIYMCTAQDDKCRSYEKEFSKLLKKEGLNDYIVYLNLSGIDQEKFVEDFNNKYEYKVQLTSYYPAIVVFEEGKITDILQGDENDKLTVRQTEHFLDLMELGE